MDSARHQQAFQRIVWHSRRVQYLTEEPAHQQYAHMNSYCVVDRTIESETAIRNCQTKRSRQRGPKHSQYRESFGCAQGVRVTEVPLSLDSLNSGDVFILDLGQKIVVWAGSAATGMEKNKALTYTIALRDDIDHKGTAQVTAQLAQRPLPARLVL